MHAHASWFSQGGVGKGTCRRGSKPPERCQVKCLPKEEIQRCLVSGTSIICGRKIKFCDIISGDRECRCQGHKNFILGKCKPPWECSINNLRQETGQHSCTKNNISRTLTSFDNLGTIQFHFRGCLKVLEKLTC